MLFIQIIGGVALTIVWLFMPRLVSSLVIGYLITGIAGVVWWWLFGILAVIGFIGDLDTFPTD